jgi:hypothetical protein
MKPPESLPAQAFLLAFHPQRRRLTARTELGYLLRAAALADLVLCGHLVDESGKARAVGTVASLDPVLQEVWEQVAAAEPRSWRRWITSDRRRTFAAVRDQLADTRVVTLEQQRFLGLFPHTRITLRETPGARRIRDQVGRAIRGGQPVSRVDRDLAALAALAAAAQLRVVLGGRERRQFQARLGELGAPIEPIAKALRRAIAAKRAAAASGG